jgi:hypothetical protein
LPASSHDIFTIGLVVGVFFILVGIRRRREAIRSRLRLVILGEAAFFITYYVLAYTRRSFFESLLGGTIAVLVVMLVSRPRSRYIPASVKRKAKAEFELRTGKKFNSRKHEYDHEVPFSRGGSHTTDNLRVVEKKKNRSKGAKSPWWDVLGK